MSFLTHLECSKCGKRFDADKIQTICDNCGKPLFARYDLEAIKEKVKPSNFSQRVASMWRYLELLPLRDSKNIVTLGEGYTPLTPAQRLGASLEVPKLYIKNEGINPTGTFKDRGLSMAVSRAKELGITRLALPSAGNAAGAMTAYGARAGLESYVFMPVDAPEVNKIECSIMGANVKLVNGLISDCGKIVSNGISEMNWFPLSTLKEPYRVEGKKTMGLEIAEQMDWTLPEVIIYPTGGGTGIIGMWKTFDEMETLGWIDSTRPRMISVQADGCAPIVKAFEEGLMESKFWEEAKTIAAGLRVPHALGDFLILDAIQKSKGRALSVSDEEILDSVRLLASSEGIFSCPEGAATLSALRKMVDNGEVDRDERVVLFNTGTGIKYTTLFNDDFPVLDPEGNLIHL